jgi:hypothetical protein
MSEEYKTEPDFGRWTYGDAGDYWDVSRRDILKLSLSKNHILACGDLEEDNGKQLTRVFSSPKITYSDAPYGPSDAASYRTKAALDNDVNFYHLIRKFGETASATEEDIFLEVGKDSKQVTVEALIDSGMNLQHEYEITYYGDKPALLLHGAFGKEVDRLDELDGKDDSETPPIAIEDRTKKGDIVADFFAGRGFTPLSACRLGRRSIAHELHPRRLACAVDRMVEEEYGGREEAPDDLLEKVGMFEEWH